MYLRIENGTPLSLALTYYDTSLDFSRVRAMQKMFPDANHKNVEQLAVLCFGRIYLEEEPKQQS